MKSILKFSFLISVILSFSSCLTLHNGVFYNSAQLNTDNFRYVKMNAEGSSTATYFLAFGGGLEQTLMADAKKDLIRENPLKSNQTLVNTNVNYKITSYFGIVSKLTCTINADIVEFGKFSSNSTDNNIEIPTVKDKININKEVQNANMKTELAVDSIPTGHIITVKYPKEATLYIDGKQVSGVPFVGFLTIGNHHLYIGQGVKRYRKDIAILEKARKSTFTIDFPENYSGL
jgi:hypothetical protein